MNKCYRQDVGWYFKKLINPTDRWEGFFRNPDFIWAESCETVRIVLIFDTHGRKWVGFMYVISRPSDKLKPWPFYKYKCLNFGL